MRRAARLAAIGFLLAALAGCTTLGTNVRGSFACAAPGGVCAPSSVIDDRALALIAGEEQSSPASRRASGPTPLRPRGVRGGEVVPVGQRVLSIVFLPHMDELGRFHERRVVRAPVEQGAWLATPSAARPLGSSTTAGATLAAAGLDEVTPAIVAEPRPAAVRAARARARGASSAGQGGAAPADRPVSSSSPRNPPAGFPARVEE